MASQIDTPDIETQDISTRTGMSVLTIMWQRKSLVVLGIMLGLVLGLLYYAQKQPIYQSTAAVLIVKKSGDTPMDFGRADGRMVVMEDYIATQQTVIQSPSIITRALKRPPMKDLKTLTSDNDWDRIYDIQQMLIVMRDNQQATAEPRRTLSGSSFAAPFRLSAKRSFRRLLRVTRISSTRSTKTSTSTNSNCLRRQKMS